MKELIYFLFFIFCFYSCKSQNVQILPLKMAQEVDTLQHDGIISSYRTDYFLVKGNSTHLNDSVRKYVEVNLDSASLQFNQYDMKFYKESESLNEELINKLHNKYKAFIDEKPIVTYTWFDKKLVVH